MYKLFKPGKFGGEFDPKCDVIVCKNQISISEDAIKRHKLEAFHRVKLLYDDDAKRIGLKFENTDDRTVIVRNGGKNGRRYVEAKTFYKWAGIDPVATGRKTFCNMILCTDTGIYTLEPKDQHSANYIE